MNTPPYHQPLDYYGNKTYDWFPSDSEESYQRMNQDPRHREYFKQKGWDQPGAITYKFNSHAFRSEEFDPDANNLVTLGCSFTMGVGLPVQDVWPSRLGQTLNLRVCNFGWGGYAADSCFRLADYWIPQLKPRLVVLLNPPRGRMEIVIDDRPGRADVIMPGTQNDMFLKRWLSVDANARLNNKKNSLAIQAICQQLNIPFLSYEADMWMSGSREDLEYARDFMHSGPRGHEILTKRIIDDFATK